MLLLLLLRAASVDVPVGAARKYSLALLMREDGEHDGRR